jgi:hypothetical protein
MCRSLPFRRPGAARNPPGPRPQPRTPVPPLSCPAPRAHPPAPALARGAPPQVSLQTAKRLKDERQAEQCRDLRAVLNLLLHVTQSEALDGGDGVLTLCAAAAPAAAPGGAPALAGGGGFDVAHVVLIGLHIVLPLISPELLKFPKLGRLYYSLLSYLLEAHTAAVAALEREHFASLMASLEWGLAGGDDVAAQSCFEGVAGLGRFQLGAVQTGGAGLAAHAPGARAGGRAAARGGTGRGGQAGARSACAGGGAAVARRAQPGAQPGVGAESGPDVAHVVLIGLHIVLPLLSPEPLKFPKLGRLYYSLLSYLLEAHTAAVQHSAARALPPSLGPSLYSLPPPPRQAPAAAWWRTSRRCCCGACSSRTRRRWGACGAWGKGRAGPRGAALAAAGWAARLGRRRRGKFCSRPACAAPPSPPPADSPLSLPPLHPSAALTHPRPRHAPLCRLGARSPQDAIELASDALLPLLLAEPSTFQPLAAALAAAAAAAAPVGGQRSADAVTSALGALGAWLGQRTSDEASGEAGGGPSRGLQRDFRQQMCQLVADVRAFTKMR